MCVSDASLRSDTGKKTKLVHVTNTGAFFTEAAAAERSSSIILVFHWHRPSGAEPPAVQSVILQDVVNLRRRIVSFAELLGPAALSVARPADGNKHLKTNSSAAGAAWGNGEKSSGCDDSAGRWMDVSGLQLGLKLGLTRCLRLLVFYGLSNKSPDNAVG